MSKSPNAFEAIQRDLRRFRNDRDWRQFHTPKNLAMSIAIEAAELMEHFQWLTPEESEQVAAQEGSERHAIGEEIADILMYCFHLTDILELDPETILREKLAKNAKRFPIDRVYGKYR